MDKIPYLLLGGKTESMVLPRSLRSDKKKKIIFLSEGW